MGRFWVDFYGILMGFKWFGRNILLGFSSGFIGGKWDDFVRILSDSTITIPALAVLIVIQSLFRVDIYTMAILIALFSLCLDESGVGSVRLFLKVRSSVKLTILSLALLFVEGV